MHRIKENRFNCSCLFVIACFDSAIVCYIFTLTTNTIYLNHKRDNSSTLKFEAEIALQDSPSNSTWDESILNTI